MGINIFFYSLLILYSSLFATAKVVPEIINQEVRKKPQDKISNKPMFSTSLRWPATAPRPTEVRRKLPRDSWLKLGRIPRSISSKSEKSLISPASSVDSRDTTISAITQDSALSPAPREKMPQGIANKQGEKVIPIDSELSHSDASINGSLATTHVDMLPAQTSASFAGTEVLMPAAEPMQMNSQFPSNASLEETYEVPQTKVAIERKRRNLYDAIKDWHSDLATKRAESIRLQNEIAHLKLTQIKGEQRRREVELLECHDDIAWIQGHIERCNNQLAALPREQEEEENPNRLKVRRKAVLLEYN